jgi:ADP-ribose pyrophosphatase YjhB (NUDIX family)
MSYPFNVRVYGLLIDEQNGILLSDEEEYGFRFSKFPGGGLEYGEGLMEALIREFKEECDADVEVLAHFYTTDFFIKSVFNESQVISVYYLVKPKSVLNLNFKTQAFDFDEEGDVKQAFRWRSLDELTANDVTFETDQRVVDLIIERYRS